MLLLVIDKLLLLLLLLVMMDRRWRDVLFLYWRCIVWLGMVLIVNRSAIARS